MSTAVRTTRHGATGAVSRSRVTVDVSRNVCQARNSR